MCVFLENPHVVILTPKVMVLTDGALGGGQKGGTLLNGISVLTEETPESSLLPFLPGIQ